MLCACSVTSCEKFAKLAGMAAANELSKRLRVTTVVALATGGNDPESC